MATEESEDTQRGWDETTLWALAETLSARMDELRSKPIANGSSAKIVQLVPRANNRPPALSDKELGDIRRMLREHAFLRENCALHRQLLDGIQ